MKAALWVIGKTTESYLKEGCAIYVKKIPHYLPFEYIEIPDLKLGNASPEQIKKEEEKIIFNKLQTSDHLILLDEKGKEFSSPLVIKYMIGHKIKLH
jgi:23S rRNA (pseudouridine1915-N3)-methyltransferase